MFTYKSNEEGRTQLYLYNLENNSVQKLTNMQSSIGSVEWSSDDKYLLFNSFVERTEGKLIKMPKKPKGAKWNSPPIEIDDMYTAMMGVVIEGQVIIKYLCFLLRVGRLDKLVC